MRVLVMFEFEGVKANSDEAKGIVEQINESCEVMQAGFDAQVCLVQDVFDVEGE